MPTAAPFFSETEHQYFYETDAPLTAKQLAESLLGLDGVVTRSTAIISRLLPQVVIEDAEVFITSIELGSYKDNFLVRLIFGEDKAAEKNIEKFRQALGLKKMDAKRVIGIAMLGNFPDAELRVREVGNATAGLEVQLQCI